MISNFATDPAIFKERISWLHPSQYSNGNYYTDSEWWKMKLTSAQFEFRAWRWTKIYIDCDTFRSVTDILKIITMCWYLLLFSSLYFTVLPITLPFPPPPLLFLLPSIHLQIRIFLLSLILRWWRRLSTFWVQIPSTLLCIFLKSME